MNGDRGKDPLGVDRWTEALSWHAALREGGEKELTHSVGREWQDWYADADNRQVFDDMSRLLADRHLYRKRRRRRSAGLEDDSYDLSAPITEWRRSHEIHVTRNLRSSRRRLWLRFSGGTGVIAITILIVLWLRLFGTSTEARPVVYQTNIGELRDVHLPDGSSITLGGRTEVSVTFSEHHRSVTVMEGQAWFKVAHNMHWPFVVTAGHSTITDVGTAFLVTRDSDRVIVTVTEGAVEVSARPPTRPSLKFGQGFTLRPILAPIRVSSGEQVAFSDSGALSPLRETDTYAAVAWTRGRLTFDNQPLRYVIETVNRYSTRRIVISPSAGVLRFSGIVFDNDIEDWLQSLKLIFPVSVNESGAGARIQLRDAVPQVSELPRKTQP